MLKIVKSGLVFLFWLFSVGIFSCANAGSAEPGGVEVTILKSWEGDYPVAALDRLPVGQQDARFGYIDDPQIFEQVWQIFKPLDSLPDIDFAHQLVIFYRNTDFYNQTAIARVLLKGNVIEILARQTMSALPIEDKLALALAVIPRAGVAEIQTDSGTIPIVSTSVHPSAAPDDKTKESSLASEISTSVQKKILEINAGDVVDPQSMRTEIASMLEDLGYVQQTLPDPKTGRPMTLIEEYGQYRMLFSAAENASVSIEVHIREGDMKTALHYSDVRTAQSKRESINYYGTLKKRLIAEFGADNVSDERAIFAP